MGDQGLKPVWNGGEIIALRFIVGADVEQDDIRVIGDTDPAIEAGIDFVDAEAVMAFVIDIGQGGRRDKVL